MKRLCILVVLAVASLMVGCAGTIDTPRERLRRYGEVSTLDAKMFADDWDFFWLYDHPSAMTKYHPLAEP